MTINASVAGTWQLAVKTPIGTQNVQLEITDASDGLRGTARGAGEDVELLDLRIDGRLLSWQQQITRPLRLNLTFEVVVDGDQFDGVSRAGRLPSSKVTGVRVRR